MSRIVLRAKCDRGAHTPAWVTAEPSGYVVHADELVLTGYGSKSRLDRTTYPLDDGEAAWLRYVGCRCGRQFTIDSLTLSQAIARGDRLLVLEPAGRADD